MESWARRGHGIRGETGRRPGWKVQSLKWRKQPRERFMKRKIPWTWKARCRYRSRAAIRDQLWTTLRQCSRTNQPEQTCSRRHVGGTECGESIHDVYRPGCTVRHVQGGESSVDPDVHRDVIGARNPSQPAEAHGRGTSRSTPSRSSVRQFNMARAQAAEERPALVMGSIFVQRWWAWKQVH